MSENPAIKQFQLAGVVYDLQVDSVNNCNPTAASQSKFDWVGTQAEYVAQDVATNHPDWVCFITDDISDETGIIDLTNYVKKTGNETISGTKTFSSGVRIERSSGQRLVVRQDSNNVDIGSLESTDNGNNNKTELFAFSEDGTQNAILGVTYGNGSPHAYAPTPTSLVNNNTITTAAYITRVLSTLYPVGSLYLGTQSTCPLITLIPGSTWELVAQDRSLQGSSTNHAANTTIAAGLPDHTHAIKIRKNDSTGHHANGSLVPHIYTDGYTYQGDTAAAKNASESNPIYGASTTVQPPAYVTNVWRRTA